MYSCYVLASSGKEPFRSRKKREATKQQEKKKKSDCPFSILYIGQNKYIVIFFLDDECMRLFD